MTLPTTASGLTIWQDQLIVSDDLGCDGDLKMVREDGFAMLDKARSIL